MEDCVWVFIASETSFPSGIFNNVIDAEEWIVKYGLTGILTEYIVGKGVLDWAIATKKFVLRPHKKIDAKFIGNFTTAAMTHYHYEDGKRL